MQDENKERNGEPVPHHASEVWFLQRGDGTVVAVPGLAQLAEAFKDGGLSAGDRLWRASEGPRPVDSFEALKPLVTAPAGQVPPLPAALRPHHGDVPEIFDDPVERAFVAAGIAADREHHQAWAPGERRTQADRRSATATNGATARRKDHRPQVAPRPVRPLVIAAIVVVASALGGAATAHLALWAHRRSTASVAAPTAALDQSARRPQTALPDRPGLPPSAPAPKPSAPAPAPTIASPSAPPPAPAPAPTVAPPAAPATAEAPAPAPKAGPAPESAPPAPPAAQAAGPDYAARVREGDRLLDAGRMARAEQAYQKAIEANPDGAEALAGLGFIRLDQERAATAITLFKRALSNSPTYPPAHLGLAEAYRVHGDVALAIPHYRKFLTLAPRHRDAPAARHQLEALGGK